MILLDASLVKGSHGAPPASPLDALVLLARGLDAQGRRTVTASQVHDLILAQLFPTSQGVVALPSASPAGHPAHSRDRASSQGCDRRATIGACWPPVGCPMRADGAGSG